ncbi:MAG: hypothetical protein PVH87_24465 [Desulfobacteraceae bacterium]|jgi:hypothetical protein
MEWTITLNEENQYAEIVTCGIADRDGSREMAKEISMALSKAKIKKILIDHRNISAVSGEAAEIYDRPKEFKEIGAVQGIKVAEVVKADHKAFFHFLETVCVNRGYLFSIFDDKKSALGWLLSS